jgi:hypothetical protein
MALSESVVSELLDAFRAGDGVDLIRESVRLVLQELIELEATEVIGARPGVEGADYWARSSTCATLSVDAAPWGGSAASVRRDVRPRARRPVEGNLGLSPTGTLASLGRTARAVPGCRHGPPRRSPRPHRSG